MSPAISPRKAITHRPSSRSTDRPRSGPTSSTAHPCTSSPMHGNGNGLYQYTYSSTFPQNTYQSENYWVDVVFAPTGPTQPPGQVTNVTATAGALQATVNWTPPTSGGATASYRITPYIGSNGPDADHGRRARDLEDDHRPDRRHHLHLHRHRDQRKRQRPGVGPLQRRYPDHPEPARRPDRSQRQRRATAGDGQLDPPASDGGSPITKYRITPYIGSTAQTSTTVARTGRLEDDHRPHRRHHLHLQGRRDQRRRGGPGIGTLKCHHPDHSHRSGRPDRGQRQRRGAAGDGQLDHARAVTAAV